MLLCCIMLLLGRTSVKLKESTHNRIYVLKAVLNLWENCTVQNCFLFERLIFYLLLGSKYRIGQQTLCKLRGFFPSKTSVGPCQWKKKLKEKVTMPRQLPHFLSNWSKRNYILPSLRSFIMNKLIICLLVQF